MTEQVTASPQRWVNEHIRRYLATGGADGHEWKPGVPTLLLTTTGRRSALRRRTAGEDRPADPGRRAGTGPLTRR